MSLSEEKKNLIRILLSSSESEAGNSDEETEASEDSDIEFMNLILTEEEKCGNFKRRGSQAKRNCIRNYLEEIVPSYTEEEFKRHFRIRRSLFKSLCQRFENSSIFEQLRIDKISCEKHLATFLWFAGHEACSFRDLVDRFNLSLSTTSVIIRRVTNFISNLSPEIVSWPTEIKKKETSAFFFNKTGFPNVIGAIDGTHIVIDPPTHKKDDYINRKGQTSIVLQGICDEKRKFISFFVGFPGSSHDSWVFRNSFIYPKLKNLCGEYYILGDSAYKCTDCLLTPYRDNGHLTTAQRNYNKKLSSCRIKIEHAFGVLKQRFRQLYYCKLRGIKKLCHFVRACIVLHNLCDEDDLEFDIVYDPEPEEINIDSITSIADSRKGKEIRNRICRELREIK